MAKVVRTNSWGGTYLEDAPDPPQRTGGSSSILPPSLQGIAGNVNPESQYSTISDLTIGDQRGRQASDLSRQNAGQNMEMARLSGQLDSDAAAAQLRNAQALNQQKQSLATQDREAMLAAIPRITAAGGGGTQPMVNYSGPSAQQQQAARDAAFARAKDTAGAIARSSLDALNQVMAGRGIMGSSNLAVRDASWNAIAPAASQLNEVTREQLIQDLGAAQHSADMQYQGGITQRGQDRKEDLTPALLAMFSRTGAAY